MKSIGASLGLRQTWKTWHWFQKSEQVQFRWDIHSVHQRIHLDSYSRGLCCIRRASEDKIRKGKKCINARESQ